MGSCRGDLILVPNKIIFGKQIMVASDRPLSVRHSRQSSKIPAELIYEIMDKVPMYRKGYKEVLTHTKQLEDIMGCSSYQWVIIEYFLELLFTHKNKKNYWVAANQPGLHINKGNNFSADILVFNKKDLPGKNISTKYANIPALLHIEVDISVELVNQSEMEYLEKKITSIMSFGTQRLIWVFTKENKILVVESENPWEWYDLDTTLSLIEDIKFNIAEYLKQEGVNLKK